MRRLGDDELSSDSPQVVQVKLRNAFALHFDVARNGAELGIDRTPWVRFFVPTGVQKSVRLAVPFRTVTRVMVRLVATMWHVPTGCLYRSAILVSETIGQLRVINPALLVPRLGLLEAVREIGSAI